MTGSQRAARVIFASAIIGGCAVGLAAQSHAEPGGCDPMARSMTPHQPSACDAPLPPPPGEDAPVPGPVNEPAVLPPPGAAEFPPPSDS